MADGTSVGKLTLDLEIRDKVAAQLEELKNCKRSSKTYFVPLSRKYRKRCKYAVFYTMTKGQKKSYQQD